MNIGIFVIIVLVLIICLALVSNKLKVAEKAVLLKCLSRLDLSKDVSYSFIFLNYKAQDVQSIEDKLMNGDFENTVVIFIGPLWLYKTKQKKLDHIKLIHASSIMKDPSIYKTNAAYVLNGNKIKFVENANYYV